MEREFAEEIWMGENSTGTGAGEGRGVDSIGEGGGEGVLERVFSEGSFMGES